MAEQQEPSNDKQISNELKDLVFDLMKQAKAPLSLGLQKHTVMKYHNIEFRESRIIKPSRKLRLFEERFQDKFEQLKAESVTKLIEDGQDQLAERLNKFTFNVGRNLGDKMIPIVDVKRLSFDGDGRPKEEPSEYRYEEGVVNILLFWQSSCEPSWHDIDAYVSVWIRNREQWQDKVRIVCLAFDDNGQAVVNKIAKSKGWSQLEHYYSESSIQANVSCQLINIPSYPYVIIIDKFNQISNLNKPNYEIEEHIKGFITAQSKEDTKFGGKPDLSAIADFRLGYKRNKQFLKEDWKDFIVANNIIKFHHYFKLRLSKYTFYDQNRKKIRHDIKKLKIKYKIQFKHQDLAKKGINLIRQTLAPRSFAFKSEVFSTPHLDFSESTKFLQKVAAKYGITLDLYLKDSHSVRVQDGAVSNDEQLKVVQLHPIAPEYAVYAHQIKEETYQHYQTGKQHDIEPFKHIMMHGFDFSLGVGDQFHTITNLHPVGNTEQSITLASKPGEILLIVFWQSHDEVSLIELEKLTFLFKAHPVKHRIRLVAISVSDEKSCAETLAQNKHWSESIEFLFFRDGLENPAHYLYKLEKTPHYVSVGSDGTLESLGKHQDIVTLVHQMLLVEEGHLMERVEGHQDLKIEVVTNLNTFISNKDNFKDLVEQTKPLGENMFYLEIGIQTLFKINSVTYEKSLYKTNECFIRYWLRKENRQILDPIFKKIFAVMPEHCFNIEPTISDTIDVPFPGKECALCKTALNDKTPQYFNFFANAFYCTACAEFDDTTKVGNARFKVTDNLLFINAPLTNTQQLQEIDTYRFGKNVKIKADEKGEQCSPLDCFGCTFQNPGPRYLAISVVQGYANKHEISLIPEFCAKCFGFMKNPNSQEAEAVYKKCSSHKVTPSTPLLRVLFYHDNYDY